MVKIRVTKLTLPVKAGLRTTPLNIDLSERIDVTEGYAPAVSTNLSASDDSASFFKYKYAERATRDGTIPTTEELKGVCVKEMTENHPEKLHCDVQKILKEAGHTWLWTPPYCPWLQPIETFWAHGKNHAASKNRNGAHSHSRERARNLTSRLLAVRCCSGRTMKQCMSDLRDGWYGCDNYHKWIREGRPIGRGPVGTGEVLSVEQRHAAAQHRFGQGKSEDDWIPSDCCRPSNVAGLIEKAKGEAEAMIAKTDGLSGTLADLVKRESQPAADGQTVTHRWVPDPTYVDPSAILVEPHTRDMSDLIGLPQAAAAAAAAAAAKTMTPREARAATREARAGS